MTVPGHRHERIAEEIQHSLTAMLEGELKDPRLAATVVVTEVRVSPDLKLARVYISVAGDEAEKASVLAALEKAAGYIRRGLTFELQLRKRLEILFVLDRSEEYGRHIEDLLRKAKRGEES